MKTRKVSKSKSKSKTKRLALKVKTVKKPFDGANVESCSLEIVYSWTSTELKTFNKLTQGDQYKEIEKTKKRVKQWPALKDVAEAKMFKLLVSKRVAELAQSNVVLKLAELPFTRLQLEFLDYVLGRAGRGLALRLTASQRQAASTLGLTVEGLLSK